MNGIIYGRKYIQYNRVPTDFFIITLMDTAERPDHKYTIPTCELPIVLELSTLEVRPARNGKSRDSRFVTSQSTSRRAGRSAPAAAHRDAAAFLLRE